MLLRLPVRIAASIVLAVLLTACGDGFQAPAAVVDGREISMATLRQELDVLLLDPQFRQSDGPGGESARKDLTRRLLMFLIQVQVVRDYAAANDLTVTSDEIDRALQETIEGLGGESQFRRELRARGLTLGAVRRNLERQVLFRETSDSIASDAGLPSTATQQEKASALQDWLGERLRSADIEVNPRFGRLDPESGAIVPITSTTT